MTFLGHFPAAMMIMNSRALVAGWGLSASLCCVACQGRVEPDQAALEASSPIALQESSQRFQAPKTPKAQVAQHQLVLLSWDAGVIAKMGSRRVSGTIPRNKAPPHGSGLRYEAVDANDNVVLVATIPPPHRIHGEFISTANAAQNIEHVETEKTHTSFRLRAPISAVLLRFFLVEDGTPREFLTEVNIAQESEK